MGGGEAPVGGRGLRARRGPAVGENGRAAGRLAAHPAVWGPGPEPCGGVFHGGFLP